MTKDEWEQAENALHSLFNYVKLNIDGYEITLKLERVGTYKNVIMLYINDKLDFKLLLEDCEERRRFARIRTRTLLKADSKKWLKKQSKKLQAELTEKCTYTYYEFWWTSFNSLKKHLIKNNTNIEVIKICN